MECLCLIIVLGLAGLFRDAIQGLALPLSPIFCLKDGFSGSSLGKAIVGVQVVDKTTGAPIGFGASFKRNLPLLIPFMPLIVAFQLHKGYRDGDGWANTRVIWKKYRDKAALKDKDVFVRESAVEALGELRDPRAVEPLIEALKDEDSDVRWSAAYALGELKDPRAVEPLIKALKDESSGVRNPVAEALRKITGQNFGENPEQWQKWWEKNKGRFIKRTQ